MVTSTAVPMTNRPAIALLGCGYTLRRVAERFPPDSLVLTVRSSEAAEVLRRDFSYVREISLEDSDAVADFFAEFPSISVLVDSVPPLFKRRLAENEAVPTSLVGVKNVVANLSKLSELKRVVYLSTTGVFGVVDGSEVSEDTSSDPKHPRSLARFESEKLYQALDLESVVLRVSAIYGPGRGIGTALKSERFKLIGNGDSWGNRIQVEDLAEVVYRAIIAEEVPDLLCVSDGNPSTQKETVEFYCDTFGLSYPAATSLEEVAASGAFSRLSDQRINSSRMLEFVGSLKYPSYREGAKSEFE